MNKVSLILLLFLIVGCQSSQATEKEPFVELSKLVDQYAENSLKKGTVNSLAIAIYKDGLSYQNYYGAIDPNGNNPPNQNTLYEIASISKVFVGSLTAKAILEQKIALDDDIRMYLDGDFSNLEFEGTPVTIKDIVTHTLGFETPEKIAAVYRKIFDGYYQNREFDYDMNDLFEELKSVKLSRKPGTYYDYSNVGPELVAHVLEQVYKKSYKEILTVFLDDLGMKNTYLQEYDQHKKHLSNGYDENNQLAHLDKNPLLGGAAGIITTLPDLTKFLKFQLEGNAPFIKEASRFLFEDGEDDTGYLWDVGIGKKEGLYYYKTGTSNGIQSGILVCPDTQYGLVLITNNMSDDWSSLYNRIEHDLIEYPKINAWSLVEPTFMENPTEASKQYKTLKKDTSKYFATSSYLNDIGYGLLYNDQIEKAIEVFELATSEDPENANLYDSLGEAYFKAKQYDQSKQHYQKSLKLNPNNSNAQKYISEINQLLLAK